MAETPSGSEKVFNDPELRIMGNTISCRDSFIQISNITQAWVGTTAKEPMPVSTLIFCAIGAIAIFSLLPGQGKSLGIIPVVIAAVILYRHSLKVPIHGLNIELNSGRTYTFTSTNMQFIGKAYTVIRSIVQDTGTRTSNDTILINMANGTIVNESSDVLIDY